MKLIIVYFVIINIFTFMLYYSDKKKAQKNLWRISEKTLLITAFIGGSIGAYSAMKIFRHKTKHLKFCILVPLMIFLHLALMIFAVGMFR